MTTRTKARMLVLSIAAPALFGATVALVAQQAAPASTSVPVCVKANGQLRMQMSANMACDPSEQRVNWVVGGEVTDITPGEGLTASRQGGTVQLAVSPTLLQKDRIFSGFNDGPLALPPESGQTDIAKLDLPAGRFAIFAKLMVFNDRFDDDENGRDRVICKLHALPDFDGSETLVLENGFIFREAAVGMTLQIVRDFSTPGSVTLSCYEDDSSLDLYFSNLKITAIEASSISNVFLGTP